MTALRDVSDPDQGRSGPAAEASQAAFYEILDAKAWQHLGLTGEEYRRRWFAGEFRDSDRPSLMALDAFMRTGEWHSG